MCVIDSCYEHTFRQCCAKSVLLRATTAIFSALLLNMTSMKTTAALEPSCVPTVDTTSWYVIWSITSVQNAGGQLLPCTNNKECHNGCQMKLISLVQCMMTFTIGTCVIMKHSQNHLHFDHMFAQACTGERVTSTFKVMATPPVPVMMVNMKTVSILKAF